jgi:hypothetical protein
MGDSMSTIINATTTNGVVIQPDNSGSLVLQTNNGTTALTISTAQDTTLAGKLTTASSGIQFSDASTQTAAASPYVLKNRIINGAMVVSQRNTTSSVTPASGDYTLDRWAVSLSQASKFTVQQNAGAVTPPVGFSNYLGITSSSAYSITSGDFFYLKQAIEGFNTADLAWGTANAKTITLSFQVYSSLTGTFGGSLENGAYTRNYPFSYSIPTANTWTTISITIAGDTSGTWVGATNGVGLRVNFGLGVGSTYSGTAGAWAAGDIVSATGATSVVGTNGATFYITGVQLEISTSATPFERRLYNQELANCQRYYETGRSWAGGRTTDGTAMMTVNFKQTKRATPTMVYTVVVGGAATSYGIYLDMAMVYNAAGTNAHGEVTWTSTSEL